MEEMSRGKDEFLKPDLKANTRPQRTNVMSAGREFQSRE